MREYCTDNGRRVNQRIICGENYFRNKARLRAIVDLRRFPARRYVWQFYVFVSAS